MYTLDQLNSKQASETPYTFEFMFDGKPTGIMLSVIGQQSETFVKRAQALAKESSLAKELDEKPVDFIGSERSKELTNKLVAARIVEWAGIDADLNAINACTFVANNQEAFDQVLAASNKIGNFIKL